MNTTHIRRQGAAFSYLLEKDVGIGVCLYVDLCFRAIISHTFWHAIPTSVYISNVFYIPYIYIPGPTVSFGSTPGIFRLLVFQ